jgi:hypothetical protein
LGFSALKMGMIKLPKTAVFVDFRRFLGVLGAKKPLSSHFFWEFWGFKKAFPQFFLVAWPVEWFGLGLVWWWVWLLRGFGRFVCRGSHLASRTTPELRGLANPLNKPALALGKAVAARLPSFVVRS